MMIRMPIATVNPATGQTVRTFEPLSADALDACVGRAMETFGHWRRTGFDERRRLLLRAAELLDAESRDLGRLMALEMGKPARAGAAEAEKCAWVCRYYAEHGERFLADIPVESGAERSWVSFQPLGPVLAIMPWNFPLWQVFRFAAPALMVGNVGLLKHASNVPQCALAIEHLLRRAGLPEGAFQTLLIGSEAVAPLLADERIAAATLTGSEAAGASVAAAAGAQIKKTVLELGGSDPFVVMPSADLGAAAETAVRARTINNGQSCIAAKRFIVHEAVADEFERRFVAGLRSLRVGDPLDDAIDIGPLATPQIVRDLERQVRETVAAGARVLTGGGPLPGPGNFFAPTALADVPRGSPAFDQELFGPVAPLFRVSDAAAAVALANATTFGLGASVWTRDRAEQEYFADCIEAGQVFVNAMVASDPRLPFGGVKRSGYGRELGEFGIREFVNIKTVYVGVPAASDRSATE